MHRRPPVSSKAAKAGIALASALGAKVTGYYAVKRMQLIHVEGFAFDQKVIEGVRG